MRLLLSLYYTLIFPYLSYISIVWSVACNLALNKLISLQKRALPYITSLSYRTSTKSRFLLYHTSTKSWFLLYHTSTKSWFLRLDISKLSHINKMKIGSFTFQAKSRLLPLSCVHVSLCLVHTSTLLN